MHYGISWTRGCAEASLCDGRMTAWVIDILTAPTSAPQALRAGERMQARERGPMFYENFDQQAIQPGEGYPWTHSMAVPDMPTV
jgi:hypothetical protein